MININHLFIFKCERIRDREKDIDMDDRRKYKPIQMPLNITTIVREILQTEREIRILFMEREGCVWQQLIFDGKTMAVMKKNKFNIIHCCHCCC